jgi:hypothetical protein
MIYFSFKLEAEMVRKFITIETLEDDGTTTEEVVEVFEATNAAWLATEAELDILKKVIDRVAADVAALDDENEG